MAATEMQSQNGSNSKLEVPAEDDKFFSMISHSQRGRMDEQRCTLDPRRSLPPSPTHAAAPPSVAQAPAEQDAFFSMISHSQRGRMDEQRCTLAPSRSAPSTPERTAASTAPSGAEGEKFFKMLANSQGRRLDDQRATLPSLPATTNGGNASKLEHDANYLCYLVSKAEGSRMEDQSCSLPKMPLSSGSPAVPRKDSAPRSSSDSGIEKPQTKEKPSQAQAPPAEQDAFFSMISHSQRGRMDEQRCTLDPSRSAVSTPKHTAKVGSTAPSGPEGEQFFKLLANSQGRRLDDQRASLPTLPGTQNGRITSKSGQDSDQLCYMVSKVQGSRMEEQRCSAPHILLGGGSPAVRKKSNSKAKSPTLDVPGSGQPPRRSASYSPISEVGKPPRDAVNPQNVPAAEQDKFFSMISHSQRGRMDEQRCTLNPNPDSEKFFNLLANTQSRRLDDQRAVLRPLAETSGASKSYQNIATNAKDSRVAPQIVLTEGTPVTLRKARSRPGSPTKTTESGPTRSASFSPPSEYEKMVKPPQQMTVKLSMNFSSQQGFEITNDPGAFPEIFLTLGTPGETIVVPLSPSPGRPLSLNLNLVPKEGSHSSPHQGSPRQPRSPKPGVSKPPRSRPSSSASQGAHRRSASPNPASVTSPISPEDDFFSLIQRVHTAQLQRGAARGGGARRVGSGKRKGRGDHGRVKTKKDPRGGKRGGDGRKDRDEGGRKV